jgi:hypothetical protein
MPLVRSNQLDGFATVPHCLDNQFLPAGTLRDLYHQRIKPDRARSDRTTAVRREYIRALLYSPEVVVNRAFAVNEPAVFSDLQEHPASVAELIQHGHLTLLMMNDAPSLGTFLEDTPMELNKNGKKAWQAFLRSHGDLDLRYLRLSADENEAVGIRFSSFVRQLFRLEMSTERLAELFTAAGVDGKPGSRDAFKEFLRQQARTWLADREGTISRTAFYQQFIVPDPNRVAEPDIDPRKPFAVELKLLGDLAYNHNLPVTLRRQSFIPTAMPSPLCLPPDLFPRRVETDDARQNASGICDRTLADAGWMYQSQEAFLVPDWADLTAADVRKIQTWPEWQDFRTAQRVVAAVSIPDQFDQRLAELFRSLELFQGRLAREITNDKGILRHLKVGARSFRLLVRPIITWAGKLISPTLAGEIISDFAAEAIEYAIDIGISFMEQRQEREVEAFRYRADGVRQNVFAGIRESAEQRQQLEHISEMPAPPLPVTPSAQRA